MLANVIDRAIVTPLGLAVNLYLTRFDVVRPRAQQGWQLCSSRR